MFHNEYDFLEDAVQQEKAEYKRICILNSIPYFYKNCVFVIADDIYTDINEIFWRYCVYGDKFDKTINTIKGKE